MRIHWEGGSFEGERLRGKVLAGGGDWVTVLGNGAFTLDLRVTLETDGPDGHGPDAAEVQKLRELHARWRKPARRS